MRSCQAERLAAETVEERVVRLQQMRDGLAADSLEEREMRLQQMRMQKRRSLGYNMTESHRELRVPGRLGHLHLPLIQQRAVQTKMQKFHAMAALEVSSTHKIICLPLLTWNDTGLGDPHPICDQFFLYAYLD